VCAQVQAVKELGWIYVSYLGLTQAALAPALSPLLRDREISVRTILSLLAHRQPDLHPGRSGTGTRRKA
jgi:hypothetical protein